eukprot:CAMPEP_0178520230 /NCGR_PEP_ID=MMETSP0696-20121128/27284_1 /TAXON_ID=265572 /ORGANISM="Extubocellulus spinifer, Strain CCMP396" /LENGTH=562 /DNA_ID=CAMNT_0020151055 /DNA_START=4 /DNA_END=1692 /DNA_ORIENTATION=-
MNNPQNSQQEKKVGNVATAMESRNPPPGAAQLPSRAFGPTGTEIYSNTCSTDLLGDYGTSVSGPGAGRVATASSMPSRSSFYAGFDALSMAERNYRMTSALRDLDSEINRIDSQDKMAYQWAVDRCPKEARSKRRREAFLEREGLNAKLAAQRMVRYWEERHVLFGPDRCFLPMTLHGALRDEVRGILENPINHILDEKDMNGMSVIYSDPDRREGSSRSEKNEAIALWYILETLIAHRRSGLVFLSSSTIATAQGTNRSTSSSSSSNSPSNNTSSAFNHDSSASFGMPSSFNTFSVSRHSFDEVFPLWFSSIHSCAIGSRPSMPNNDFIFNKKSQESTKIHTGTQLAILKSLEENSLPSEILPTAMGGAVLLDSRHWVHRRLAKEYTSTARRQKRRAARRAGTTAGSSSTSFSSAADRNFFSIGNSNEKPRSNDDDDDDDGYAKPPVRALDVDTTILAQKTGRKADERMKNAAIAKLRNPLLSRRDALIIGGYEYPDEKTDRPTTEILDAEGVSLYQRMNHLNRRVRQVREKVEDDEAREQGRLPPVRKKRKYTRKGDRKN